MVDQEALQALAQAIQQMKGRIESHLTLHEKQLLRGMIANGSIKTPEDLRAYIHRAEQAKARRDAEREAARELSERQRIEEEGRQAQGAQTQAAGDQRAAATQAEHQSPPAEESQEGMLPSAQHKKGKARHGGEEGEEEDFAKLTAKVIDAKTRRPIAYVAVVIKGSSFSSQTETTGTFIFEELKRGKIINIDCHHKQYKPHIYQYKSTMDDEQNIVIKLVALEDKTKKKPKTDAFGGH